MATALFCQTAPKIYMGFWAGNLTDRWGKDRVMRVSVFLLSVLYGSMAWIWSFPFEGNIWVVLIFTLQVFLGLLGAFYEIALLSSVSAFVLPERYTFVYGMMEFCAHGSVLLVPILGSFLYPFSSLSVLFIAGALCAALLFLFLWYLPFPDTLKARAPQTLWSLEAFRFIRKHLVLRRLLAYFAGFNFFNGLASGLIVAYVLQCCQGNTASLGVFSVWMALAALGGSALSARCRGGSSLWGIILSCGFLAALCGRILFGASHTLFYLVLWGMVRMGLTPLANMANQVLWSQWTPPEKRGSVFGARRFVAQGGFPIAILCGGLLFKGMQSLWQQDLGSFIQMVGFFELLFAGIFAWRILRGQKTPSNKIKRLVKKGKRFER